MRWERLFADLEAELAEAEATDLAAEVADRTRYELGRLRLADRLRAAVGTVVQLEAAGLGPARGVLADTGPDWLLLHEDLGGELLVAAEALLAVAGIGRDTAAVGSDGELARRLDLRWALRGLVRSRAGVDVVLRDGTRRSGTLDRVGADHVDLAEHDPDEPRRARAVRQVLVVPLAAVSALRRG